LLTLLWPATPTAAAGGEPTANAVYTGIVIDARGLAIRPALLPKIFDESGRAIYAPAEVDAEAAVQRGYVAYAKTFEQAPARARVGDQPLVLRARRVAGEARVDLVLSSADAAQIHNHVATQLLLKRCQVLIMM
jgi:hypothetical protein